jgi:hypothetical protein
VALFVAVTPDMENLFEDQIGVSAVAVAACAKTNKRPQASVIRIMT